MNADHLERDVWNALTDAVASGQGPWRYGTFCCFAEPGVPWMHQLAVRGAHADRHTLDVRGVPVTLVAGSEVMWTFTDPVTGLRAVFEGQVKPPDNPYRDTWGVRVRAVVISHLDAGRRRLERICYGPPAGRRTLPFDPMETLL